MSRPAQPASQEALAARYLAGEGARIAVADIDGERAGVTCNAIGATGGRAVPIAWDIGDLSVIHENLARIEAELGGVDILINNTGGPPPTEGE